MKFSAYFLAFFLVLWMPNILTAQTVSNLAPNHEKFSKLEDSLRIYGRSMVQDSSYEVRDLGLRNFDRVFNDFLLETASFGYDFDSLNTISALVAPDSTFKIFTWQVCENSNTFHYYGYIQMADGKVFPLQDASPLIHFPQREVLDAKHWYGSLYYKVQEYGKGNKKYYLLYGFDANDLYIRRKLIDVLSFKDDKPVFGAPIFITREEEGKAMETANRFVLEYGAVATVSLNYDAEKEMILFDNLIPFPSPYKESGFMMLPDGSYRGMKLKKGKWYPVEKVYTYTQEEAPRPTPILESRKGTKGLFGEGKN